MEEINLFDNISLATEKKSPQVHFSVSEITSNNVHAIRGVNSATSKRLKESVENYINDVIYPSFKQAMDEGKLKVNK